MASFNEIIEALKKDVSERGECQWHMSCFCEEFFKNGIEYAIDFIFEKLKESEKC